MPAALASVIPVMADASAALPPEPKHVLRVAIVYQDELTRRWADEQWSRVEQLAEHGSIQCRTWGINQLAQDGEFVHAVRAASDADVLVIAVRDTGELPLFLHVWIDAWIPLRCGREGALLAILGIPAQPDAQTGDTRHYLETVARRVGMEYLPRERTLPGRPRPPTRRRKTRG